MKYLAKLRGKQRSSAPHIVIFVCKHGVPLLVATPTRLVAMVTKIGPKLDWDPNIHKIHCKWCLIPFYLGLIEIAWTSLMMMISDQILTIFNTSGNFILTSEIVSTAIGCSPTSNVICELLFLCTSWNHACTPKDSRSTRSLIDQCQWLTTEHACMLSFQLCGGTVSVTVFQIQNALHRIMYEISVVGYGCF